LISGSPSRRSRALAWSTLASALLHIVILTLAFYAVARTLVSRGERETISKTTIVTVRHQAAATPRPVAPQRVVMHRVRHQETAPAHVPLPELAKTVTAPARPMPPQHRTSVPSKIERDEAGYAKEVAQLNAQDDPRAIPTIEPDKREPSMKQYAFNVPSSLRGDEHGNGIITPTQHWRDNGRNCYYGRYEFTYPDGAQEYGDIVWPFCYEPALDPFRLPPHEIPFPFPLPGYKLPPGTQLPPIEKSVYDDWIASGGASAP
jgi:hypothetical protein